MASIGNDKNGRKRILFVDKSGRRKTVRLGRVTKKTAEQIKLRIERLNAAAINDQPPDEEMSRWLDNLNGELLDKLAAVGLARRRERLTLQELLDHYRETRTDVTEKTKIVWRQPCRNLIEFFGPDRPLQAVTPGDADEFKIFLESDQHLSETTVGKRIQFAKQFFRYAVRKRFIHNNPFAELPAGNKSNPSRQRFISREVVTRVIDACPDAQWRLIIALSRYGGLRCPSETLDLQWGHIDWSASRINVRKHKTAQRTIPLFPELVEPLRDVWEAAKPGTTHVITKYRGPNLRTGLLRIMRRAGVEPWPRLFHNLRASRQTELENRFPTHVVCYWLGNSESVARKHYLQVTDEHFTSAAHNPAQQGAATGGTVPHSVPLRTKKPRENAVSRGLVHIPVEDKGVEPSTS